MTKEVRSHGSGMGAMNSDAKRTPVRREKHTTARALFAFGFWLYFHSQNVSYLHNQSRYPLNFFSVKFGRSSSRDKCIRFLPLCYIIDRKIGLKTLPVDITRKTMLRHGRQLIQNDLHNVSYHTYEIQKDWSRRYIQIWPVFVYKLSRHLHGSGSHIWYLWIPPEFHRTGHAHTDAVLGGNQSVQYSKTKSDAFQVHSDSLCVSIWLKYLNLFHK